MVATIDDGTSRLSQGSSRRLNGLRGHFQAPQAQTDLLHVADDQEFSSLRFNGPLLQALLHGGGSPVTPAVRKSAMAGWERASIGGQKLSTGGRRCTVAMKFDGLVHDGHALQAKKPLNDWSRGGGLHIAVDLVGTRRGWALQQRCGIGFEFGQLR